MKVISLWEPWATLMALSAKRIETRDWGTGFRGEVAIHATVAGLTQSNLYATCADDPFLSVLKLAGVLRSGMGMKDVMNAFPRGKIIAVGRLADSLPLTALPVLYPRLNTEQERAFGDYSPCRFGLVFEDIRVLTEPVPFKSRQGKLLDLDPGTEELVRKQIPVEYDANRANRRFEMMVFGGHMPERIGP